MKTLMTLLILTFSSTVMAQEQEIQKIYNQISHLAGSVSDQQLIAESIYDASIKHDVEAEVLVAVCMVESTFNINAVSNTGDYGIGQVNIKSRGEEFLRRGLQPLDITLLTTDIGYSIDRTAEILAIHTRGGWSHYYGVYHSKTPDIRTVYTGRVLKQLQRLQKMESDVATRLALN